MVSEVEARLDAFVEYCNQHIKGDEKGEAQIFLERLFRSLGHENGIKGAGATLEDRIKKEGGKGTLYADLVWKPRVMIEMKKRDTDLSLHYQQASNYWMQLVPDRPNYMVLCNFDEFWVYDLNVQLYTPVQIIKLSELPTKHSFLAFLKPEFSKPNFGINAVEVTKKAADEVAQMVKSIIKRKGASYEDALRYGLQCVIALFAEDIELLPRDFFTVLIKECQKNNLKCASGSDIVSDTYDAIGGLFKAMHSPAGNSGGKYKGVPYFNGGLFEVVAPIELTSWELDRLHSACMADWRKVKPAIFGSIFEGLLEVDERHKLGAHFTSEIDIKKIIDPVVIQPFLTELENIDNATKRSDRLDSLYLLLRKLRKTRVLDPACGSGNFLFVAYKEMKLLERTLLSRIREYNKPEDGKRLAQFLAEPFVSTKQFYGIDIKKDAVELAKVTLMVAKELSILDSGELFDTQDKPLPLDNLDDNILCEDALFIDWPEVDLIVGNPPFQSKNKMQEEFSPAYIQKLRARYTDISGLADFCAYWFRRAHDHLKTGGRAGLVGTNTIRQNYSREASLDYVGQHGGDIYEAYSSFNWSGEAAVFVSVACWMKGKHSELHKLYLTKGDGDSFDCYLVDTINSALSLMPDLSNVYNIKANKNPKSIFQGQTHGHEGFLLEKEEAVQIIKKEPKYSKVLKPYLIGDELVSTFASQPSRFIIDFDGMSLEEASTYTKVFDIVKRKVLPERQRKANAQAKANNPILDVNQSAKVNKHHLNFLKFWWRLSYGRAELFKVLADKSRVISCSRVTKRPIFEFISTSISPNDALMVFPFDDYYSFGIIQSTPHWLWFKERCSTLGQQYRYTSDTVWSTFPWPQNATLGQIMNIAKLAKELHTGRQEILTKHGISLKDMYRLIELPGANPMKVLQSNLDFAVCEAYGWAAKDISEYDILNSLLKLNKEIERAEIASEQVIGPGFQFDYTLPDASKGSLCVELK